ncbi:hypothetical protein B0H10DRAFT_1946063 [Mycena sp. CBHHK59/15]|nr:hypothetical protein B0H10DRAFT_1946063 [Mycena sp. CBHHK59/15]
MKKLEGAAGSNSLTGLYNDELSVSSVKASKKHKCAKSNGNESETSKDKHKHQKSDSSSVSRCNAEARTQLSHSVNNLSATMGKPIITTEDVSHVDEVIHILQDKALLPSDPKGKFFHLISSALSREPALGQIFILEEDHIRCKGMLEGILEDAGIEVPDDY